MQKVGADTATKIKSIELVAQVTRADGTVEEPFTAAYWHRNPLRRLHARFVRRIKGRATACA